MHLLQKNGVAAGVIQNNEDLMEKDPHLRKRAFYQVREHPEMGTVTYDGLQFKFSESPGEIERAPLMGSITNMCTGKYWACLRKRSINTPWMVFLCDPALWIHGMG